MPDVRVADAATTAATAQPAPSTDRHGVPHDSDPAIDLAPDHVRERRLWVERTTGTTLRHVGGFSFAPQQARGNIEGFTGVAQVPLGFAGPLLIDGEHVHGEVVVPLATTEGTLVASYSRGMKVLTLAGGVRTTVSADAMQRAPVFGFDSAREARAFREWVAEHFAGIKLAAESTSRVARLDCIDVYLAHRFAYARFSFETGDAAGQNMVGKATLAACEWILGTAGPALGVRRFFLESNLATDKKPSHVNMLRSRGKHVTAEATIPRALLVEHLRATPEQLREHWGIANVGAWFAGVTYNGLHAPNAVTAMFSACGQDGAHVAEAAAATFDVELTPTAGLYLSLTIPSLIVATHGGGTGLATQRECLESMGCFGRGKAPRLAEIVAGVALAGELSLGAAISANEWVSAHERYGRKR
jgi:hydroxymethylglutaryl-CoA reductase (NADPH)